MLNELFNPETVQNLDYRILGIISSLLVLSLILFILASKRFLQGKPLKAGIQSLSGLCLLFAGLLFLSIAINFYSYERLTYEQPVAELKFRQLDKKQYRVEITYKNQAKTENFLLNGDEWQLDARIIKWHGWAQLLGLNARYRLDRISGRYSDIEEELANPKSAHALGTKDEIDYWKLVNIYQKWSPFIDAYYGSATYLPMTDNASYSVSLTQTGLIARPLDTKTEDEAGLW